MQQELVDTSKETSWLVTFYNLATVLSTTIKGAVPGFWVTVSR